MTLKKQKIFKKLPNRYELLDPCRSLEQAESFEYPKEYKTIMVKTYPKIGNKDIFPFHTDKLKDVE